MNVKAGKLTKWVTDFAHRCVFSGEALLCQKYQNNYGIINLTDFKDPANVAHFSLWLIKARSTSLKPV